MSYFLATSLKDNQKIKMRRRISQDRRRRQEASMTEDRPMRPARSAAVVAAPAATKDSAAPTRTLYPTVSNLHRHGIVVGTFVEEEASSRNANKMPQDLFIPRTRIRRHQSDISQLTMPYDLRSFDAAEFDNISPSDDYLDDEELDLYLKQLAKEEAIKTKERESIKQRVSKQRKSLQSLLCTVDASSDGMLLAAANDENYLERLLEEQIQVQQKYCSHAPTRISECS
jgi:hypothetical protein